MMRHKGKLVSFFIRTLVAILVIGGIYGVYYVLHDKTTKAKPAGATKASVRAKLNEHALAITSVKILDISDPAVGYRLESLRGTITSTRDAYKKEVEEYKNLNPEDKTDFLFFITVEDEILKTYDAKYNELKKVIIYRPLTDLGSLDPTKDKDEIISRINATLLALNNISQNNTTISAETKSAMSQSVNCLTNLRQSVTEQKNDTYKASVEQCDKTYSSVRINTVKDLVVYLQSPATDNLIAIIRNLVNKLN